MLIKQSSENQVQFNILPRSLIVAAFSVLLAPIPQSVLADSVAKNQNLQVTMQQGSQNPQAIENEKVELPKIQLAIILDTSNSMDGLIDQTRNQLWQVVNEFSTARQNGITPILEIALFEYGNDSNSESAGFVRMLNKSLCVRIVVTP